MTFPTQLIVPLIVGLAVFGGLQTYHLYVAESEIDELKIRVENAETSARSLLKEKESLSAALEERRVQLEHVQNERNRANAKLSTLIRSDPDARSWADVPVPPALLGVFK